VVPAEGGAGVLVRSLSAFPAYAALYAALLLAARLYSGHVCVLIRRERYGGNSLVMLRHVESYQAVRLLRNSLSLA
jgi:hypothetical protein